MVPHLRADSVTAVLAPVFAAAAGATVILTSVVRRYAIAHSVIDLPNERSSHVAATPRGGGLAIVAVVLAGLIGLTAIEVVPVEVGVALGGGGVVVAIAGWLDDRRRVQAGGRFAAHLLAAAWTVWWLGGMPSLVLGPATISLGLAGAVLAGLAIAWAINLYNFMDGIDGLAAGEALLVGLIGTGLLASRSPSLAALSALVAGSAAGFLPWNWSPARIFLGDVGSGFLGYFFGALALASERSGALPAVIWVLLLGVFFVDATVTLVIRMIRRERWYSAHRSHAYQRGVQSGWTHRQVAVGALIITSVLGGLAWLAEIDPRYLPGSLVLAAVGLAAVYRAVVRRPAGVTPTSDPVENSVR